MGAAAVALAGIAFVIGRNAHDPGITDLMVVSGCIGGACLGFLWYNSYPAEVFMGDVGALALGARPLGVDLGALRAAHQAAARALVA